MDFALKELISPDGAFYSGLDADTEREEGKFYVWTKNEILELLEFDAELFCEFYGITESGNFEAGKNVLSISNSIENMSEKYKLSAEEVKQKLEAGLKTLYEVRSQRTYPHVDDKIIASRNGLMINHLH